MEIQTTRFGRVQVESDDVITFPQGLVGMPDCRQWVLLADVSNDALGWLQCVSRSDIALAVVSPRRFVPGYQVRITRSELQALGLDEAASAQVLAVANRSERGATINLQAPLVINLEERLGRQIVAKGELPLQYEVTPPATPLRKSA